MAQEIVDLVAEGSTVVAGYLCRATRLGQWWARRRRQAMHADEVWFFTVADRQAMHADEVWFVADDCPDRLWSLGLTALAVGNPAHAIEAASILRRLSAAARRL